jgi:hypothetical protein
MTDRKLRVTLSVAAWCGVFLWSLALLASATAVVSANAAAVSAAPQISRP